jgi:hypothetical protein
MTSEELKKIILLEIQNNDIDNWHGITKDNILKHLVTPTLIDYVTAWNEKVKKYWLVLDEEPEDKKMGYQIIYDEEEKMFGLATKTTMKRNDIGAMIGLYGSFISTLNGM